MQNLNIANTELIIKVEFDTLQESRRKAICYYIYATVFCLITAFLFWKCRYGFGNIDEAFFITTPYRLLQGDKLILHEWHLSQTSSVLLIPAVKLQLMLFGNMDGVILHFRYIFTAVWSAFSLFFFIRLRQFSAIGAALASYVFLIYAPFGIMALSYNSMGILTLTAAAVIMTTAKTHRLIQYVISGIFYAASVLCCPFLVTIYILYSVGLAAIAMADKHNRKIFPDCDVKHLFKIWLCETLGAALSALPFLVYIFSNISISKLLEVIPLMLDDPEHSELSFFSKARGFSTATIKEAGIFIAITIVIFLIVKLRKKHQKACLIAMYVNTCLYLICAFWMHMYINHIMFPLNLLGIYCALNYRSKITSKMLYGMYMPGLIYTFCIYYSSNQRFYVISSASTVSIAASIIFIVLYTKELFKTQKFSIMKFSVCISSALISVLMCVQLSLELYLRYNNVFWDTSIHTQTELIGFGPEKGILATPQMLSIYSNMYEDVSEIGLDKQLNVLFLSKNTWLYLCSSNRSASYSAWLSGVRENSVKRLKRYYKINKSKAPDIIFVESQYGEYVSYFTSDDSCVTRTENGNYIIAIRQLKIKKEKRTAPIMGVQGG